MKLLKLNDISLTPQYRVFKESALVHLIATLIFVGAAIGMYLWYRFGELPLYIFILSGGFLLLCYKMLSYRKMLAKQTVLFSQQRHSERFLFWIPPYQALPFSSEKGLR